MAGELLARRYRVKRLLGEGGMSTALLVRDEVLDTDVCLKILRGDTSEERALFQREFESLIRLVHPSLVRVHDFGALERDGRPRLYLTSDAVLGAPIDRHAAGRTWDELRSPFLDAVEALAFLHRAGLVHGDIKPGNVLVDSRGRGVLIDLSCVRRIGEAAGDRVSGTPGFFAPELLRGAPADVRSDLYALGVTMQRLLRGLREPAPSDVARLAERLAREDSTERPLDADEVLEALAPGAARRALRPAPRQPRSLLGRARELAELVRALDRLEASESGPRAIVVTGEKGSGKTRLLAELTWIAQTRLTVIEGFARAPDAMRSLLARATGEVDLARGPIGAIAARDRLLEAGEPVVLLLDGLEELPAEERASLEAFARLLEPADPILFVATESSIEGSGLVAAVSSAVELRLGPLDEAATAAWVADVGYPDAAAKAFAETAGFPADITELVAELAGGAPRRARGGSASPSAPRIRALREGAKRALAFLVVLRPVARDVDLGDLAMAPSDVAELVALGLVAPRAGGFALARPAESALIAHELPLEDAHDTVARLRLRSIDVAGADERQRSRMAASAASHLVAAGRSKDALEVFVRHADARAFEPRAWLDVAQSLVVCTADPDMRLLLATALSQAGAPALARKALEPARASSDPALVHRAACRVAEYAIDEDDARGALAELEAAPPPPTDADRALAAHLASRAHIRLGEHAVARGLAEGALALAREPSLIADLHEDAGVAASYTSDHALARMHLATAAGLRRDLRAPRRLVRTLSYQAIDAYRAGNAEAAQHGYREALAVAEEHELADQIARASLNLATACHARGALGEALTAYERGLRVAIALGQEDLAVVLEFNLAKLYADAGAFERAALRAVAVSTAAEARAMGFFAAAALSVRGDAALARGAASEALDLFERARAGFERVGAAREAVEEELEIVRALLSNGALADARELLTRARSRPQIAEMADLRAIAGLASSRVALASGAPADALLEAEAAEKPAEESGQPDLAAQLAAARADALAAMGREPEARAHAARAHAIWSRMAEGLPEAMRDAFFRHPRRLANRRREPEPSHHDTTPRSGKIERLLFVFRKLNSSLETERILELAMDAAIELTSAERGFLVVVDPEKGLHVPVARNIDREKIGKSHLKYSRGIAERAIASGEPVMTVDARSDERFRESASVHAMRLRSVLAVPIRSPDRVLGALYLDNRFGRARFADEDVEIMLAFADQVALALRNAALVAELRRKAAELSAERARIEELARGQAERIDQLTLEVKVRKEALERHYDDDRAIVGRSAAMRRVFAMIDRVATSPLSVLVTGESGTGKELVARAVHLASPRKDAPFVGINCAALPASLLESELFGYVRGAFTGADRDRRGLLAAASGGTFFLDELGELPLEMQAKLLRVLEERAVRPLGSTTSVPVDFRLVCATNRALRHEVERGRFREDLYFRVSVVEIALPPLRDRLEDLPALCRHFLRRAAEQLGRPASHLSPAAMRALGAYAFPGNVRELENILMRATVLADGAEIGPADLGLGARAAGKRPRRAKGEEERARIVMALERAGWNVVQAARDLDLPRATLYRRLLHYRIARPESSGE